MKNNEGMTKSEAQNVRSFEFVTSFVIRISSFLNPN